MKKKAIEKVPYLHLPKVKRGNTVEYVAVTAVMEIAGEQHLFIEVYRNKKECKEIPVVRIAMTTKDFGTYFTENGAWSRGNITRTTWSNYKPIWTENDTPVSETVEEMVKKNVLYAPEDLERIQKFVSPITAYNKKEWWTYIGYKQEDITKAEYGEKTTRRYEKRQQALQDRIDHMPVFPEQDILSWADSMIFRSEHHLYYKKHRSRATVTCSACGGVTEARWKPGESYESQFEQMIDEPQKGMYGKCPKCGSYGKYVPQGHERQSKNKLDYLFLGQKYKDGMVFRYIEVKKEWQLQLLAGEKEDEMIGAYEKLSGIEIARVFFEPGKKKIQKDYQKHNPWSGKDFWDDCNLYGLSSISINRAAVMPQTYEEMKGTYLQYSAMKEYEKAAGKINPVYYLERYIQIPQIEMLVKMGMIRIVEHLLKWECGIVADIDAKRMDLFLGIRKERVKQLMKDKGRIDVLEVMQREKRLGENWTDEQIEHLAELGLDNVGVALEYMGVQKLLNRVAKYAGCEYGTMCSTASERLRNTARIYRDYLGMRINLGYDFSNTVYLFPKNLSDAHEKMVMESNKKEADKRIQEVNIKYPLIKKHYRRLRKTFYFEDDKLLIRPARDAGEIVMEGRILHHCVGGDEYLSKHNGDKSTILFLRDKADPDMPYVTVEIKTDSMKILQWYGSYDKKPDEKRLQRWLDAYVTRLKCAGTAEEDAEQRVLIYA